MLYMAGFFHSRILLPEAFVNDESVKREMKDAQFGMTRDGISVYIKITDFTDGRPPVIQFKAK